MADYAYVKTLTEKRLRAWEAAKEILDRQALDGGRERTAEENEMFDRANADIDALGRQIDEWHRMAEVERQDAVAREAFDPILSPSEDQRRSREQVSDLKRWFAEPGQGIEVDFRAAQQYNRLLRSGIDAEELRAVYTDGGASGGSLVVPTTFVRSLYQFIEASSAIRRISYVFTTTSGEPMTFPKVVTHGVGTQVVAQGTAIGGTDPVLGTLTLNSYKYGQLVKVSYEAADDVGFDLLGFIAENIGRAIGRITDTAYVTGGGSTAPNGILTAASVGAKTGGSLIAVGGGAATAYTQNLDCLIDLQHSVVDEYRTNASWVMNDLTAGTIRKLKDGGAGTIGNYVWVPSAQYLGVAGQRQPDMLLGNPAYTDVNFGTQGSAVKSIAFGDFSRYYVRDSGSMRIERSTERYFDTDEIGFKGILRTDSDLIDTGAIKLLQQLP